MRRLLISTFVCWSVLATARPAPAQTTPDDKAEARKHWDRATRLYDLGRYDEAIKEFEASYEISGAPGLLFNIAQSYRLKGDCASALTFYKRYVLRAPEALNRDDAEAKIAEMQRCVDQASAPAGAAPAARPSTPAATEPAAKHAAPAAKPATPAARPTAPAPVRPPAPTVGPEPESATDVRTSASAHPGRSKKQLGVGLMVVGSLSLAIAAYYGTEAVDKREELNARFGDEVTEWDDAAAQLEADGRSAGQQALGFGVAGGAALAGGMLVYWAGWRQDRQVGRDVALVPSQRGWQLVWSCAF